MNANSETMAKVARLVQKAARVDAALLATVNRREETERRLEAREEHLAGLLRRIHRTIARLALEELDVEDHSRTTGEGKPEGVLVLVDGMPHAVLPMRDGNGKESLVHVRLLAVG